MAVMMKVTGNADKLQQNTDEHKVKWKSSTYSNNREHKKETKTLRWWYLDHAGAKGHWRLVTWERRWLVPYDRADAATNLRDYEQLTTGVAKARGGVTLHPPPFHTSPLPPTQGENT